jgi:hypothetical protein
MKEISIRASQFAVRDTLEKSACEGERGVGPASREKADETLGPNE